MDNNLRISLIIGIIIYYIIILFFLRKKSISLKYSLLWIFSAAVLLIMSIFPQLMVNLSHLMGFELVTNEIFLLFIFFILLILISITSIVSKQHKQIKTIAQDLALLEKDIKDLTKQVQK